METKKIILAMFILIATCLFNWNDKSESLASIRNSNRSGCNEFSDKNFYLNLPTVSPFLLGKAKTSSKVEIKPALKIFTDDIGIYIS